jgi:hypothetical protein
MSVLLYVRNRIRKSLFASYLQKRLFVCCCICGFVVRVYDCTRFCSVRDLCWFERLHVFVYLYVCLCSFLCVCVKVCVFGSLSMCVCVCASVDVLFVKSVEYGFVDV